MARFYLGPVLYWCLMKFESAQDAISYIWHNSEEYSQAKANRVYLEEFRKSKKAILISMAPSYCKTVQERDSFAYSHKEYLEVLTGYREAVKVEENLKWRLKCAEEFIHIWRTREATRRMERQQSGVAT